MAKRATTPTITMTSAKVELSRSAVTAPPIRIPEIHSGNWTVGSVKRVVPGIGTPIRVAMIIRIATITAMNFIATEKERDQGSPVAKALTKSADAMAIPSANHGSVEMTSAMLRIKAHPHQAPG